MGWVIDLDGVMWLANTPIAGSAEAIAQLRQSGEEVLFVTNNSYSTRAEVEAKLAEIGVAAHGAVISSAMAAGSLVEAGERVFVCGGPGIVEAVTDAGGEVVGGIVEGTMLPVSTNIDVVVAGLTPAFNYQILHQASSAVRDGARFVATNSDPTYPTPQGLFPGGGSIVAAIETASGQSPTYAGKPHEPVAKLIRQELGSRGVVVGDVPSTDGRLAHQLGFRFGLVLSGVTSNPATAMPPPDFVGANLQALVRQELGS